MGKLERIVGGFSDFRDQKCACTVPFVLIDSC